MGMAASQARYLALTSRMNDIEYQGQQINQQRTTLSSQINALYNSLLEMNVPTPPSTQSYTKVQYSGSVNASGFTLNTITPKSDGTYDLKLGFAQSGNVVSRTNKAATVVSTPTQFYASPVKADSDIALLLKDKHSAPEKGDKYGSFDDIKAARDAGKTDANKDNLMILLSKSDLNSELFSKISDAGAEIYIDGISDSGQTSDGKHLTQVKTFSDLKEYTGNVYIKCNAADVMKGDEVDYTGVLGQLISKPDDVEEGEEQTYSYKENAYSWSDGAWYTNKTEYTDNEKSVLLSKNLLIKDGNGARYLEAKDINKNLNVNDLLVINDNGDPYKNINSKTQYAVKNSDGSTTPLYTLKELLQEGGIAQTYYDAAVKSLKHSFPDEEVENTFYAYINQDGELEFIRTKDTTGITDEKTKFASTYKQTPGTYAETKEFKDSLVSFDNDGKINSITIKMDDGNTYEVKMSAETVTDNEAYEDAFNEYEYAKYKYDREQHEINLKTSIIQAEDKNLELKLTRLDNERNAVNTELEAVKKVIQDNIDKGFKTFSG